MLDGWKMFRSLAEAVGLPHHVTGALVVAWNHAELRYINSVSLDKMDRKNEKSILVCDKMGSC